MGSSASAVPLPTRIASWRRRRRCPSARAAGPVIHWLSPVAVAILPSALVASFSATSGRRWRIRAKKPAFSRQASASRQPTSTAMPAARSRAMPLPSTRGSGSTAATTARAMPAASMRSAQGGVRP